MEKGDSEVLREMEAMTQKDDVNTHPALERPSSNGPGATAEWTVKEGRTIRWK
jgi:hypothetical protein